MLVLLFGGRQLFGYTYDANVPFFIIDPINGTFTSTEKTEHYSIIFHTFVFMQIFNELNARKIGATEYNIFHGFFNNFLFLGIVLGTIIVQCLLIQYGGVPIRTSPLTLNQHLLCIGIGMFSLVQGVIIKAILPPSWFEWMHFNEEAMSDEEEKKALVTSLRKSFRQSLNRSATKSKAKGL